MKPLPLINYIINHPLNKKNKANALWRFVKWQLNTYINPFPVIYPFTDKAKLIVQKGMSGATQNIYCGLHDYQEMLFLLHFLRDSDLFVDVGANVGSYTVLAAAHVGASAIAFEPVPSTYANLINNIQVNNISQNATAYNLGVGSKKGSINFTNSLDAMNHVALENDKNTIKVSIETLDHILKDRTPTLIKIDVEGYETEVINGGLNILKNPALKAIIIELNGSGNRYGYNDETIHKTLIDLKFSPYSYNPATKQLHVFEIKDGHNVIYLRDLTFVKSRLDSSKKVSVNNQLL